MKLARYYRRLGIFLSAVFLLPAAVLAQGPTLAGTGKPEALNRPAVSAAVLRAASSPTTRADVVKSLLGNVKTKSLVAAAAASKGIGAGDLDKVVTQSLPLTTGGTPPAGGIDALDWKGGLKLSPISVPTFTQGGKTYRIGMPLVGNMWTGERCALLQDVLQRGSVTLVPSPNACSVLELDLPKTPATYAVTIKLMRYDGQCKAAWVEGTSPAISVNYWDRTTSNAKLTLIRLADGTGYAGVVSVTPSSDQTPPEAQMRSRALMLQLLIVGSRAPEDLHNFDMLFGGWIITRL